jgi:hypothetical protein
MYLNLIQIAESRGLLRDLLTKEATDDEIFATMAAADMVNGPNVEVKS